MIRKILNLIYEALSKMVGYKTIIDAYDLEGSAMSDEMSDAIDKRNKKLSDVFASLEQLTKALPAEMQRYTRELSNLSDIKRGIADLEKAIIQSSNSRVVTKEGVVVTPPSTKMPLMLKIAIYIIALYSFIMMVKEMYPVANDLISKYL